MTRPTPKIWVWLLIVLICADLVFIWASVAFVDAPLPRNARIVRLGSYYSLASVFLYFKWLVGAWWLLAATYRTRAKWIGALAAVFSILFIDDLAEIHDKAGAYIGERLPFDVRFGLQAQDYGELVFHVAFGAVVFGLLAWSYRTAPVQVRKWPAICIGLVIGLAVSGVGFDMLHTSAKIVGTEIFADWITVFGILEDGGELLWGSALLTLAYIVSRLDRRT